MLRDRQEGLRPAGRGYRRDTDVCSAYLLFLRMAALSGALDYMHEAGIFRNELTLSGKPHLGDFLEQWSFE